MLINYNFPYTHDGKCKQVFRTTEKDQTACEGWAWIKLNQIWVVVNEMHNHFEFKNTKN